MSYAIDLQLYNTQVIVIASMLGSVAFALSGFMMGARKQLDLMGAFVLAFTAANGGGVIRDLIVGRTPAIMHSPLPFWLAAGTMALAMAFRLREWPSVERHVIFIVSDAIGLAAFGITGALVGIEANLHFFGVVTLSFLTATGGGIIRDMLVNEVPLVLYGDFYGSVALLLGMTVFLLHWTAMMNPALLTMIFFGGLILRLVAYRRGWKLPKV